MYCREQHIASEPAERAVNPDLSSISPHTELWGLQSSLPEAMLPEGVRPHITSSHLLPNQMHKEQKQQLCGRLNSIHLCCHVFIVLYQLNAKINVNHKRLLAIERNPIKQGLFQFTSGRKDLCRDFHAGVLSHILCCWCCFQWLSQSIHHLSVQHIPPLSHPTGKHNFLSLPVNTAWTQHSLNETAFLGRTKPKPANKSRYGHHSLVVFH